MGESHNDAVVLDTTFYPRHQFSFVAAPDGKVLHIGAPRGAAGAVAASELTQGSHNWF
jgi:hypothetical protein